MRRRAIEDAGESVDEEVFAPLRRRLSIRRGDYGDPTTYDRRWPRRIDGRARCRCSTWRSRRRCSDAWSRGWRRPGVDQGRAGGGGEAVRARPGLGPGAQRRAAASLLEERQIFRIDHFLGKEPVHGHPASCGSPTRSSSRCGTATTSSSVQITMAESFGVEDRGSFYDPVGRAARRGAEPPAADHRPGRRRSPLRRRTADGHARTSGSRCSGASRRPDPAHYVRGQYDGYRRRRRGVQPDSQTETFAALRLEIDNWRWAGVPFFIRAGKAMAGAGHRGADRLQARTPEPAVRLPTPSPTPDELVLRIDPDAGRRPGDSGQEAGRSDDTRTVDLVAGVRRGSWAKPRSPTSGCWPTRCAATPATSPARTASRRPGASCSRCWKRRRQWRPISLALGDRPARRNCLPDIPVGGNPGCRESGEVARDHCRA